jgi:hypothetical protein
MKHEKMSYEAARRHVQIRRPKIEPNNGFTQQLLVWNAIKDDWEKREDNPEYRYWQTTRSMKIVTSTNLLTLGLT